ncbi:MAG: GtrA family protein, partial [Eubacterium sp.]|nr:GtrA family protein [Eubacterium sp.]
FAIGTLLGNLISILIALVFAYVTNRHWVFRSQTSGAHDVGIEFLKFAGGRATTLVIEIGGVQLTTILFPGDSVMLFIGKLITQVLVIVLNFVFSKLFVFREKKDAADGDATATAGGDAATDANQSDMKES